MRLKSLLVIPIIIKEIIIAIAPQIIEAIGKNIKKAIEKRKAKKAQKSAEKNQVDKAYDDYKASLESKQNQIKQESP